MESDTKRMRGDKPFVFTNLEMPIPMAVCVFTAMQKIEKAKKL
jgi:hypothetical protein